MIHMVKFQEKSKKTDKGKTLLDYLHFFVSALKSMERVKGIEPSSQAWEAHVLPLNHTRVEWG